MNVDHPEPTDVNGCQEFAKNSESKEVVEEVVMPGRAVINDGAYDLPKYIDEQSKEEICRDLSITETQFRLGKSRAKAHLTRLGAERLAAA